MNRNAILKWLVAAALGLLAGLYAGMKDVHMPRTIEDLGIYLAVAGMGLLAWLVKSQQAQGAAREIAMRRELAEHNKRITDILANDLGHIATTLARAAEILQTIQRRDEEVQTKALEYMAASSVALAALQRSLDDHDRSERGVWERLMKDGARRLAPRPSAATARRKAGTKRG